jgi:glutamate dehydrogenase
MSLLLLTRPALDMSDLAAERKRDAIDAIRLYSIFNDALGLTWLHNQAEDLEVEGRWQAKARSNLRDEFYRLRRELAFQLLTSRTKKEPGDIAEAWLKKNSAEVDRFTHMIDEMKLRDEIDFATLTVAAQELRDLISK